MSYETSVFCWLGQRFLNNNRLFCTFFYHCVMTICVSVLSSVVDETQREKAAQGDQLFLPVLNHYSIWKEVKFMETWLVRILSIEFGFGLQLHFSKVRSFFNRSGWKGPWNKNHLSKREQVVEWNPSRTQADWIPPNLALLIINYVGRKCFKR